MTRVGIFLITVVLLAGMVGCDVNRESYTLTITSTPGGSVVEPGEGTFTYYAGTEVDLVAEADEGYQFICWSGFLVHFADLRATATTIVIDNDYSISANFAVPTPVWDWYDLNATENDLAGVYILMNDLNSTTPGYEELAGPTANGGKGWHPIGSGVELDGVGGPAFFGTFDGQGYKISDLVINRPDEYDVGLFGIVYYCGGIINLDIVNATVTGYEYVGGLVGLSVGTIANCHSASSVNGTDNVGGLVGDSDGTVSNSYSMGNVTGDRSVGGLAGSNHATVSNSYSICNVIGNDFVGGLVGSNQGSVSDSYSTGSMTGTFYVGGLVGYNYEGTVTNSHSTSSATGNGSVGGLVGGNVYNSTVSDSYASGSVTGNGAVGGLVGGNAYGSAISNSYSNGSVTGTIYVGGLVGHNYEGTVTNSYSTGSVTGEDYGGGLVGWNEEGTVNKSFWDTETSGQAASDGGTGKTTAEMKDVATFSGTGWDIITVASPSTRNLSHIWNIVDDETYPFLSWQL